MRVSGLANISALTQKQNGISDSSKITILQRLRKPDWNALGVMGPQFQGLLQGLNIPGYSHAIENAVRSLDKDPVVKLRDPTFQFRLTFLNRKDLMVQANSKELMFVLAKKVWEQEGIPPIHQRLLLDGKVIWDGPAYETGDVKTQTLEMV